MITDTMRMVALLATLTYVYLKTRDRSAVRILVRVHGAIIAEAAYELIRVVQGRHRGDSEAVIALIRDRSSVDHKVVRALHKRPLIHRMRHGAPRARLC